MRDDNELDAFTVLHKALSHAGKLGGIREGLKLRITSEVWIFFLVPWFNDFNIVQTIEVRDTSQLDDGF